MTDILVLIDARIRSGKSGGVEQALVGLADAFRLSNIEDVKLIWLLKDKKDDWLRPHLPKSSEIFFLSDLHNPIRYLLGKFLEFGRKYLFLDLFLNLVRTRGPFEYRLPLEPKIVSKIKPSLIHFAIQTGFQTKKANVYQPHDLQHIHLPSFFSKEQLSLRNIIYDKMIKQSSRVIVGNQWTKLDVLNNFEIEADKVDNVPLFPQVFLDLNNNNTKYRRLEFKYIFYPASGWPHKNHIRLLSALRRVLDYGLDIHLVLSGNLLSDNEQMSDFIKKNDLSQRVHILGFVSPEELGNLYLYSEGVIVPSLFESASFPVWEAFKLKVPVLAAKTTSIPQQVNGNALLFDPLDVDDITEAIISLLENPKFHNELTCKAFHRVNQFTPENTALGFRYSYRRALGLPLDNLDNAWLQTGLFF